MSVTTLLREKETWPEHTIAIESRLIDTHIKAGSNMKAGSEAKLEIVIRLSPFGGTDHVRFRNAQD